MKDEKAKQFLGLGSSGGGGHKERVKEVNMVEISYVPV
jgi:hypothetical protein